ncbi:alpha/beta hydrolase [Mesorhizobium sp.]|jgi:pimeloyl-ACP methyl ester carboxylesterase|uniref:alpha/beta fold hydrolase n=1 Tax=Mesorhizobium sp. TaxID=1871066 RepID=UPI000FE34C6B|nr:alpha/beta hydrolase [Mesorhizobium sp.]RWH68366.1 MAG: alpha/beta hydrolase [Mesorhizobium sp.]RWL25056.1 MAG: alpha/beta hydrolase [Mesorhizobium sp.]RWL27561.1 MAG: alpha/beta hydrolase [Mesorhizobium sp.]RWL36356.1 MAG: alpha/beta hydrolase [Mesorhizobium sp.]RWL53638.1 MAG: alpha/beta hydrolase [Mesorhizobium sp.]
MSRIIGFLLVMLIAVATASGVAFLLYRNELALLHEGVSRGSRIASLDSGPVEYADSGAGIPLLSIHGAGGGFDQGLALASSLVGEGFRIIAPSRYGYLRTPVPQDPSPAAQADALAALLTKLDVSKAVVVGVSAGARSAVELGRRHPDKVAVLILVVPALYSPASPVSIDVGRGNRFAFWAVNTGGDFAWWAAENIVPSVLIRFIGVRPALVAAAPQAERDRVMSFVRGVEPLSLRFSGINIDSAPELHEQPLAEIAAPTLIVSARDDLFNTLPAAEFAAARIPRAKLVVYDTGGHLLVGRTQEVRTAIRTFLAGAGLIPSNH